MLSKPPAWPSAALKAASWAGGSARLKEPSSSSVHRISHKHLGSVHAVCPQCVYQARVKSKGLFHDERTSTVALISLWLAKATAQWTERLCAGEGTVATSYHRYTCSGLSIVFTKPRSAAISVVNCIRQAWETNSVALPVYGTPLVGSVAPIALSACAREQEACFVSGFTSSMQRSAVVYSGWACMVGWRASCSSSASDTPSFGKLGTHSFFSGTHRARVPGSLGSASAACFFKGRMRAQRLMIGPLPMIGPLSNCRGRSRRCRCSAMLAALGPLYTSEYASEAGPPAMGR
eukprot:scaffold96011_cov63-Phaeocystis_antarctica.AAC.3